MPCSAERQSRMSANNSNLHGKSRRVYLDKFVTLPHLPANPGTGPGFNKKIDYMSPNLDHTGIRTAFQERVARPVKPNGRLTYDYRLNASTQVAIPSRTLAKLEMKKVRPHFEKNSTYEERLLLIEQKRLTLGSTCERQLEVEKDFLLSTEELEEESRASNSSSKMSKKSRRRGKKNWTGTVRPKKIFNQQGIVNCIIDTSDMSICSSALAVLDDEGGQRAHPLDGGNSYDTLRSTSSWKSGNTRVGASARWHPEALKRVHGLEHEDEHEQGMEYREMGERERRSSNFAVSSSPEGEAD